MTIFSPPYIAVGTAMGTHFCVICVERDVRTNMSSILIWSMGMASKMYRRAVDDSYSDLEVSIYCILSLIIFC